MRLLRQFFLLFIYGLGGVTQASKDFQTAHILQTDPFFSHHIILVEKSTYRLFLYENDRGTPKLVKTFNIATGKSKGDKTEQGDRKTPEGIYFISSFLPSELLLKRYGNYGKIYGPGAFPLNYPNTMDKLNEKTGGGIWIHSTDDDKRVSKKLESRGCVVLKKQDIKDLSRYIDLNKKTPVLIVEDANFRDPLSIANMKQSIFNFVISWKKAWESQNIYRYISHYNAKLFKDPTYGNFPKFLRYKRQVFSRAIHPKISFSHYSIFVNDDYSIVQMLQHYNSKALTDTGKKTLYLQKDNRYQWKIIAEFWEKIPREELSLFTPQQRFFK